MTKLRISDTLSFPIDFVTQTQAILAKKRVGKSYTAAVQAEELLKAGQQIVAVDPTGAWWGLKSSADGKHAGFPIAIFGGEHADVPLEESAGEVIARALVEQRFSAILDLSLFRKGQINRFMAPFLETLYRLNREAMHLFVDEADAIAPQKPFGEEARMLSKSQVRILAALSQFEALGRNSVDRKWIAALAKASHTSSAFSNNLGALRSGGYIDYPQTGLVALTDEGRKAAPQIDPPNSSEEMLERCIAIVSRPQAAILQALADAYPEPLEKEQLAKTVDASPTSSAFSNNLGALRSAGMVDYPQSGLVKLQKWVALDEVAA